MMSKKTLEQKFPGATLVVGGSGGIAAAIVKKLAHCGASISMTYRSNRDAAEAIGREIASETQAYHIQQTDITDRLSVKKMYEETQAALGPINAVVYCVGTDIALDYIGDVKDQDFDEAVQIDLVGFYNVIKGALPHLRETRGSFTALTTAGLLRHPQRDILSTAPKAGVEALLRGVAREEGRYGVRANAVGVGSVQAGLWFRLAERVPEGFMDAGARNTALRRHGDAEDVANAVAFLASTEAGFITGQSLAVDGGYSI
ncbi:MAG: SDR family oxidoreductase [Sphingopyxis sp.]|nr:SDR family oxidoreductase [Sphingopyxis sp.]